MAKKKWIVPAVAMILCAASLIGAGYAAYSATLHDSETATVTNNYIELGLGVTALGSPSEIDYVTDTTYVSGAFKAITYSPQTTDILLLSFTVSKTTAGDAASSNYTLAISDLIAKKSGGVNNANLTLPNVVTVKQHSDGAVVSASALQYGTQYDLYVAYTHNDSDILKYKIDGYELAGATVVADLDAAKTAAAADMAASINFNVTVTANVA